MRSCTISAAKWSLIESIDLVLKLTTILEPVEFSFAFHETYSDRSGPVACSDSRSVHCEKRCSHPLVGVLHLPDCSGIAICFALYLPLHFVAGGRTSRFQILFWRSWILRRILPTWSPTRSTGLSVSLGDMDRQHNLADENFLQIAVMIIPIFP